MITTTEKNTFWMNVEIKKNLQHPKNQNETK